MTVSRTGPQAGRLTLHTGVEGRLSRLGHALDLELREWEADVEVDGGALVAVSVSADLLSLHVLGGHGGVTPLSPLDRAAIRRNALKVLHAEARPLARFTASSVTARPGGFEVAGTLVVADADREVVAAVDLADRVRVGLQITHSRFALTPYSTMRGGLRVRDAVDVRLDLARPAAE